MQQALTLATDAIDMQGGPFGAIITHSNTIIGQGFNQVTKRHDPTAHAEIVAIRAACEHLQSHDLSGSILYTSCEPCPMCLAASYWAGISHIYFAADRIQAEQAGFIDAKLYTELTKPLAERSIPIEHIQCESSDKPFERWRKEMDKIPY